MKIKSVVVNNRRKAFAVSTSKKTLFFPFAKCDPRPSREDPVRRAYPDREIGKEGFTYELMSGAEGIIHMENVLEYNQDPEYLKNKALYLLTIEARKRVESSALSNRELIRRLGTSASQYYRLLDQTNYDKSIGQLLALLEVLDCEVEFIVRDRPLQHTGS